MCGCLWQQWSVLVSVQQWSVDVCSSSGLCGWLWQQWSAWVSVCGFRFHLRPRGYGCTELCHSLLATLLGKPSSHLLQHRREQAPTPCLNSMTEMTLGKGVGELALRMYIAGDLVPHPLRAM